LTNDIARKEDLNLEVIEGFSPGDVKRIVEDNFDGSVDFVFIDGLHTDDQQYSDFKACAEIASDRSIFIFHDVINHNMTPSFKRIGQEAKLMKSKILYRTPTGMGILYPSNLEKEIEDKINLFFEPYERIKSFQKASKIARYNFYMETSSVFYKGFLGLTS
jgi:hypothetical protein